MIALLDSMSFFDKLLLMMVFIPTITMYICGLLLWGNFGFRRPFNILITALFLSGAMLTIILVTQFPVVYGFEILVFSDAIGILLIFPLIYGFLIEWLQPNWLHGKRLFYCFLPPFLLLLCFLLLQIWTAPFPLLYTAADIKANLHHPSVWLRMLAYICVLVELAVLTWLLFQMERKHREGVLDNFSFTEGTNLKWVRFIAFQLIIYGLSILVRDLVYKESIRMLEGFLLTTLPLSASIMSLRQQMLYFEQEEETEQELKPETIQTIRTEERRKDLKQRLLVLLEKDEIFRDPNLSIEQMYRLLNTNRTYLSQLINQDMGKSFHQLINLYRVKKAADMLSDPEEVHLSVKDIAEIVGFKSISTFNTIFKEEYDMSPSVWRNSEEKAPNLASPSTPLSQGEGK